ncbi:hypothetical protein COK56_29735 [Bacillus cereus]|nr:hypothetical protein COK56_29735 [Bacillus cereus]
MKIVHLWEVKATFQSSRTDTAYEVTQKIITKEKSFSEAERVGMDFLNMTLKDRYSHCSFKEIDEITYKDDIGTTLLDDEEN